MKINISNTIVSTILWKHDNPRSTYFSLLDNLYLRGIRKLGCAANYPLCGLPEYFRYTEGLIQEWISAHGICDMEIYARIGEINNGGYENELNYSGSFLRMLADDYVNKFHSNLKCLVVVSDCEFENEIIESLNVLKDYKNVRTGIYAFDNCAFLNDFLKTSGIIPDILINPEFFTSLNIFANCPLGDVFIDFRYIGNSVLKDGLTDLNALKKHITGIKNKNFLPENAGLILPVDDSSLLDVIDTFNKLEHAA
jgi:hypothetical protein